MYTEAIIRNIDYNSNKCTVDIPLFGENAVNIPAKIIIQPGSYNGYANEDKVWVGFEREMYNLPLVVGKIFVDQKSESNASGGASNINSLTVTGNASIPMDTKISDSENDYSTLQKLINKVKYLDDKLNNTTGQGQQIIVNPSNASAFTPENPTSILIGNKLYILNSDTSNIQYINGGYSYTTAENYTGGTIDAGSATVVGTGIIHGGYADSSYTYSGIENGDESEYGSSTIVNFWDGGLSDTEDDEYDDSVNGGSYSMEDYQYTASAFGVEQPHSIYEPTSTDTIPAPPSKNGNYSLKCKVENGKTIYTWVEEN